MENSEMPLISIIVPAHNVERYIGECLESLYRQSYKNLEIIVVNDGSTDSTGEMIRQCQKKDNRVVVIDQENRGISSARNTGIAHAKGEYIAFVDADDFVHEKMYEQLYNQLMQDHCAIAMCTYCAVDEYGRKKKQNILDPESRIYEMESFFSAMMENIRNQHTFVVVWNKLYERSLFDNIRFPVGKNHEDQWIVHPLIYEAKRVTYINKPLYYYRVRNHSIMHSGFSMGRFENFFARLDRIQFFERKNVNPALIKRLGAESISFGISYWLQMKYWKCASVEQRTMCEEQVRSVTVRFLKECCFMDRVKGTLFLKAPGLLYGGYWIKKKMGL